MNIPRNAPIGVIDSGIGGLSMLKNLVKKYPNENYIYLADNLNMPYGNKSAKFLRTRILELVNYLSETFNVKQVILACNTASITSLDYVRKHCSIEVLGLDITSMMGQDSGTICTKLSAKIYNNLNVYACDRLASDIEQNIFDIITLKRKIKNALNRVHIIENNIILGCTHYELVKDIFEQLNTGKNYICPCKEFVKQLQIKNPNITTAKGDILIISTLATKSYIDKLWKIFKN